MADLGKRDSYKHRILSCLSQITNLANGDLSKPKQETVSGIRDKLEQSWEKFVLVHNQILARTGSSELENQQLEFECTKATYETAKDKLSQLEKRWKQYSQSNQPPAVTTPSSGSTHSSVETTETSTTPSVAPASGQARPTRPTGSGILTTSILTPLVTTTATTTQSSNRVTATVSTSSSIPSSVVTMNSNQVQRKLVLFEQDVQALISFAENLTPELSLSALKIELNQAEHAWNNYTSTVVEYLATASDGNAQIISQSRGRLATNYRHACANLQEEIDRRTAAAAQTRTSSAPPTAATMETTANLPKINLPEFTGTYDTWQSFKDMFDSLVISRGYKDVDKMAFLKASVKGDAATLLRHIQITDGNFDIAWQLLTNRYDNPRVIINNLLSKLFNMSSAKENHAHDIRRLLDTTNEVLRALANLERPTKQWDDLIVYMVCQRLDTESRRYWEQQIGSSREPCTWTQLAEFLESRFRTLEACSSKSSQSYPPKRIQHDTPTKGVKSFHQQTTPPSKNRPAQRGSGRESCCYCEQNHAIYTCQVFQKLSDQQRRRTIEDKNRCVNCFRPHDVATCQSKFTCRTCAAKHHTLLHNSFQTLTEQGNSSEASTSHAAGGVTCTHQLCPPRKVLLATAIVEIQAANGRFIKFRALIDQGSQCSFVSNSLIQQLKLPKQAIDLPIHSVGAATACKSNAVATVHLRPKFEQDRIVSTNALVLKSVTSHVPAFTVMEREWPHISGLTLADPKFYSAQQVDVLLGADVYAEIISEGVVKGPPHTPLAQNTVFGWILTGNLEKKPCTTPNSIQVHHAIMPEDNLLRRFWELEELQTSPIQTEEEKHCIEHFQENVSRTKEGRIVVKLPPKPEHKTLSHATALLGKSESIAIARLRQLLRRFKANPALKLDYDSTFQEYLDLGHMEEVPPEELNQTPHYYLPHHAVLREDSKTTKCRVVFNASARTVSGPSLNDILAIGPTVQDDLFAIVVRWRMHKVAYMADIAKMYRQVLVHPDERNLQRIVYQFSPEEPIRHYRLRTVTFGEASAPFLAIYALHYLATQEGHDYPLAGDVTTKDFYVDNAMSGSNSVTEALETQTQLIALLQRGGFELRKWSSNCPELLSNIPPEHQDLNPLLDLDKDQTVKALGVSWHPASDHMMIKVNLAEQSSSITKRVVISDIARLFDPMGLLAPKVVVGKIIYQKIWLRGIEWDQPLPDDLLETFVNFRKDLPELEQIAIPRWLQISPNNRLELHAFSDASNLAYAAAVYARVVSTDGQVHCSLIASKTKVAPVKQISVPKLELCGAVLAVRLLLKVRDAFRIKETPIYGWSDSTTVLAWLRAHPSRWQTFVGNRTSEILQTMPCSSWRHIRTNDNPSDCASRGLTSHELATHALWWSGPTWLSTPETEWPEYVQNQNNAIYETELEMRQSCLAAVTKLPWDLLQRYSSYRRLLGVTAYMIRFKTRVRRTQTEPTEKEVLLNHEIDAARNFWIRQVQNSEFSDELSAVKNGEPLPKTSRIKSLNPFIDTDGTLRALGRLQRANIPEERRRPIILPRTNTLTKLIIQDCHEQTLHGNIQLMLTTLRQQFWIVDLKTAIRQCVHNCLTCFKQRAEVSQQLMSELPAARVNPSRPFSHVGVDYAGPISVTTKQGRKSYITKGYIAVFVCFAVKAVHVEAVSDLTTAAFLAAFRRFVSRRGLPSVVYSDRGTNFVGAAAELKKDFQLALELSETHVANLFAHHGVKWQFNPAHAPHFGGLWEAAVKSVKYHLKRVANKANFTFEELQTLFAQIEANLNSRRLCELSENRESHQALTPGHFLIGASLNATPEPSLLDINSNRLNRWQLVQQATHQFWNAWSTNYLNMLQQRTKWQVEKPDLKPGELVLVKEDNMPPSTWLLARIMTVHPGRDGRIRVATIKTASSTLTRPIHKLCRLPDHINKNVEPHVVLRGENVDATG